jgi:hypothetical protein
MKLQYVELEEPSLSKKPLDSVPGAEKRLEQVLARMLGVCSDHK